MGFDRLEMLKERLLGCVESQVNGNLKDVDTKELGEAVDMIKDMSEAIYYCTITKAMEDGEENDWGRKERDNSRYYNSRMIPQYPIEYYDPRYRDRMYAMDGGNGGRSNMNYHDGKLPIYRYDDKDYREGRSPDYRKKYMEGKEKHLDKTKQMQELENYVHELTNDLMEMIEDASADEKAMLQQKISTLATKIK